MGVLVKKQRGVPHLTGIAKLSIVGMIVSLSAAAMNTIWAIYLDSFLNNTVYVGLFSSLLTVIAIVAHFAFIPVIEKADKAKLFSSSLLLFILFYLVFTFNQSFTVLVIVAILMTIFLSLRVASFGILVRDTSSQKGLSRNEGMVYTFMNVAFVIGPLLAGFIAARYNLRWVFALSAFFLFIGFLILKFSGIKGDKGKKKLDRNIYKNFTDFFKSKDRVIAYLLGSGVTIWWILIYLFMPLHMIRNGFTELAIGYFLFAIAVPLIIFEYVFSKTAGKIGFRKIFKIGYLLTAIIALACFFFTNLYIVAALLVLASIGLAMIEPTTEAYFFDILKGKERYRFYSPYGTALDFGNLVGKVSGSILLIFLPFRFIFILFSIWMFLLFLLSFKTKRIVESRRK